MKLKVTNFKSISERKVDFGDNGIILISGKSGSGKCLAKNTPVLLYNGENKPVQDIIIGDKIMGDDSTPRNILSIAKGKEILYNIIPDKGKSFRVTGDHILVCRYNEETIEIKCSSAYQYPQNYSLIHTHVHFINNNIEDRIFMGKKVRDILYFSLTTGSSIPLYIKTSSYRNRLDALSYLIYFDYQLLSDEGQYYICLISKFRNVLEEVSYLALSLGFFSYLEDNKVFIYGDINKIFTYLPDQTDNCLYRNFKIDKCTEEEEYFGFELDGNKRFLLGDFTITHNSSILDSIRYVLYGEGGKDIIKYGENNCIVDLELTINGELLHLSRSKKPNKFTLNIQNETYEGTVAQNIIKTKFGSFFTSVSYLTQDMSDAFIKLTPMNKLLFLENLIITSTDLEACNRKIKDLIKEREDTLTKTKTKLELYRKIYFSLKQPQSVSFPVNIADEKKDLFEKNEIIRKKNCIVRISRINNVLTDLKVREQKALTLHAHRSDLVKDRLELENKKDKINETLKVLSFEYQGDEKLDLYKSNLKYISDNTEVIILKDNYEQLLHKINKVKDDINKRKGTIIWTDYSKDELEQLISEYKEIVVDISKIKKIQEKVKHSGTYTEMTLKLSSMESEIPNLEGRLKSLKDVYECPNCSTSLKLKKNDKGPDVLVISENYNKQDSEEELVIKLQDLKLNKGNLVNNIRLVDEINEIKSRYEDELDEDEVRKTLLEFEGIYNTNMRLSLDNEKYISSNEYLFKKMEKEANELLLKINTKEKELINVTPYSEYKKEELQTIVSQQEALKVKITCSTNELLSINERLETIKNKVSIEPENISEIQKLYDEQLRIQNEERIALKKHTSNIEAIDRWKAYILDKEKYDKAKKDVTELELEEKTNINKLSAALLLKDKVKNAESLALSELLQNINSHAKVYIDDFFEDKDISVEIVSFRESKNKKDSKPSVSIKIEYEGNDMDFSSLSGGEKDRITLAFSLALSEITNSPFVMIDEGLGSLDHDTANRVIQSIKENSNKLTIVVAHQIIKANFSKVINIE